MIICDSKIDIATITLNLDSYGKAHGSDNYLISDVSSKTVVEQSFKIASITGTVKVPKN
jgi:hypothetical protein